MTDGTRGLRTRIGVATLASLAALAAAALGAGPEAKVKPKPKVAAEAEGMLSPKEAREVQKAFQDLIASTRRDPAAKAKGPKVTVDLTEALRALGRPARVVAPPALDSAGIDALLDRALLDAKAPPTRRTTDEEFVRRACLDVTGKLPTPEQVRAFLDNPKATKRADLIDYLLSSPDFGQNAARYWRDVIGYHATNPQARLINYPALEGWLAGRFNENSPWDAIARELITAVGKPSENGAAVFSVAHADGGRVPAVEVAGEVSRVFLGVQIACAQCHDHPTDSWKREQFHQFAAFFAGIRSRRDLGPPPSIDIQADGPARHTIPDAKDPAQPGRPVEPRFFLATSEAPVPKGLTTQQRREVAASYVTGQDNPWFARSFVNHAWRALIGDGFYNPVDDIGPERQGHDLAVLEPLADAFAKGGYDVKWLYRAILNTRAYQRESRSSSTAAGKVPFASNCPSRLRADQIYDALSQALPGFATPAKADVEKIKAKNAGGLAMLYGNAGPRAPFNAIYGVDPAMPNDDVLGTIPQALFLMNAPQVQNRVKAARGTLLADLLASSPDDRSTLDALYLRVLARRPTREEVAVCDGYLRRVGDRREAFEDILWSLINSTEFISRR